MKRARREERDPRPGMLELVKAALKTPETKIPLDGTEARELLVKSVEVALKGDSEERHEYQIGFAKMIAGSLDHHAQHLEAELAAKNKFLEEANETKEALESRVKETEQAIEMKKAELQEKKILKSQDDAALKQANANLEKAKAAEKQLEVKKRELKEEQTKLNAVYEQSFTVLRDTAGGGKRQVADKLLKPLQLMLKGMGGDNSMTKGLPLAILKKPEDRGDFDNMAITAVDQLFTKEMGATVEKLALHDEEVARAAASTSEAQEAMDAAFQKLQSTTELQASADSERKELEKQLKAVNSEMAKHEKKVTATTEEFEEAEEKIRNFNKITEAFNFLNTYSSNTKATPAEEEAEQEDEEEEDVEVVEEVEEVQQMEQRMAA